MSEQLMLHLAEQKTLEKNRPKTIDEVDKWMERYLACINASRAEAERLERLHEAAHDLLEACQKLVSWFDANQPAGEAPYCVQLARDAVAKALTPNDQAQLRE